MIVGCENSETDDDDSDIINTPPDNFLAGKYSWLLIGGIGMVTFLLGRGSKKKLVAK